MDTQITFDLKREIAELRLDKSSLNHRLKIVQENNEELCKEFLRFVEHFKCFEKTSSDPSDAVAFKRAREILT